MPGIWAPTQPTTLEAICRHIFELPSLVEINVAKCIVRGQHNVVMTLLKAFITILWFDVPKEYIWYQECIWNQGVTICYMLTHNMQHYLHICMRYFECPTNKCLYWKIKLEYVSMMVQVENLLLCKVMVMDTDLVYCLHLV